MLQLTPIQLDDGTIIYIEAPVLADFAAYLANAESETATQELLAIPGLLERVKQNQATPKADYTAWRSLRTDV